MKNEVSAAIATCFGFVHKFWDLNFNLIGSSNKTLRKSKRTLRKKVVSSRFSLAGRTSTASSFHNRVNFEVFVEAHVTLNEGTAIR